jgi:hypothetical protein
VLLQPARASLAGVFVDDLTSTRYGELLCRRISIPHRSVNKVSPFMSNEVNIQDGEVPVTGALLMLIGVLHGAAEVCVQEPQFAHRTWVLCRKLFYGPCKELVKQAGLEANEHLFEVLMRITVPPALLELPPEELPKRFVFSLYADIARGCFRELTS